MQFAEENRAKFEIHHVVFILITLTAAFFFNVVIGFFYFLFITIGMIGALFKLNIYNIVPKKLFAYSKSFKKDLNIIRYHWGTKFLFFKILNRLTLISLPLGLLIVTLALPLHPDMDPVIFLNFYELGLMGILIFVISFIIDVYIILFGNASVSYKFSAFCYRCALFSGGGFIAGGYLGETIY